MFNTSFNLLLATKTISLCFFFLFFCCFLKVLFAITLLIEKTKLRFVLVVPTSAPLIVANEAIETPPLVSDKVAVPDIGNSFI